MARKGDRSGEQYCETSKRIAHENHCGTQSHADAARAVKNLRSIGIARKDKSARSRTSEKEIDATVPTTETEQPGMGKAIGGAVGGALGVAEVFIGRRGSQLFRAGRRSDTGGRTHGAALGGGRGGNGIVAGAP